VAEFKLPDLGEGVTEAEIDRWLVEEGDVISEDDPLVEVVTDKATVEIPSPYSGPVARIHVGEGARIPVGTVLVTIGASEGKQSEVVEPAAVEEATRAGPPGEEATLDRGPDQLAGDDGIKAMPPVRSLARSLGVDLSRVEGSGPGGRILRADVEAASGVPETAEGPAPEGRRERLRGVRRTIAQRMTTSHRVIPAVTHVEECDVTELDATRRLANERNPEGTRLTYLPFIVKAVVAGLKAHPALNASLDEDADEIVYHDSFHIGIAVDTPAGLIVPVIRDANRKSLRALADDVERLAQGARTQSLGAEELRGGTFTITSPGAFGGLMATPLILHPQVGIVGVHRATDRPVVRAGQIVVRRMMNLSITFDHRVLDGLTAARFAGEVVHLLEHPGVLALEE
jgi:pyruvate dehydrogenase E2 component (dihydrolipoamide acetyltransferase)